ncbi:MAG: hypothetical protein U0166_03270 [Acidobacteriota bacterium]
MTGLLLCGYSARILWTRSDVDYMCEWPSGPVTRTKLRRLASEAPSSLPVYREILAREGLCLGRLRHAIELLEARITPTERRKGPG